eukprot:2809451-Rhodomonas_salina.2
MQELHGIVKGLEVCTGSRGSVRDVQSVWGVWCVSGCTSGYARPMPASESSHEKAGSKMTQHAVQEDGSSRGQG